MSMPAGVNNSSTAALGIGARTNNVSVTSINCAHATTLAATDPVSTTTSQTDATNLTTTASSSSSSNFSSNVVANDQSPTAVAALNNGNHFYGNGSIRISVPKMEESDESETELSNIESAAAATATSETNSVSMRASINKNAPRPMSWEGELSDSDDRMDTENVASPTGNGTTSIENSKTTNAMADAAAAANNGNDQINVITYATGEKSHSPQRQLSSHSDIGQAPTTMQLLPKDAIKPEFVDNMPIYGNASSANKRYPIDMTSLKYEVQQTSHQYQHQSDAINSPLLARSKTTLLPANPSPDSAIHSVYTHSSPSQSPLTSRHTPYTPSLSRNNSDASYSSCYSYSSEFSPTHSPIQGRHNMYSGGGGSNFNGSPLHHSVLYKPMMDGNNGPTGDNCAKIVQQQHVQEDNVLEAEAIPSAGISRQQLINR